MTSTLKHTALSNLVLLILICMLSLSQSFAQLNENQVKAAYLVNFLDNLTYDNQHDLDSLKVLVLNNQQLYQATSKIVQGKKIKGLNVFVTDQKIFGAQIVYIPLTSKANFKEAALQYQKSAIVSDVAHYMTDIQFVRNEDESIGFIINDKNLKNKKITVSSELLVYSGDKPEVLSLIDQQQTKLDELIIQFNQLSAELSEKEREVDTLNDKIREKEDRLKELNEANKSKNEQLLQMQEEITAKESALAVLNSDFSSQSEELSLLKLRLEENYESIGEIADSVEKLQFLLDQKKQLVQENEALLLAHQHELADQEDKLQVSDRKASRNQTLLLITGLSALVLILVLYFLNQENRAKKEALITIENQNQAIREASKQKDEFISNLSHEVRSPLNAIIGYADLIRTSVENPEMSKNLEYITMSSRNLLGMINDILDYRKIEAGKGQLEYDNFELESVVQVAYNTLKITAESKGLDYLLDFDAELPQFVRSDSKKLNQILLNLISNAIKFTSSGKVELKVKKRSSQENKCKVLFVVLDTGIGIDKANQKMIFETFTQETELTSKEFGGSGLGLSISRKLIELFGSSISVESEPGKGAKFSFELELEIGEQNKSAETISEAVKIHGIKDIRFLIVDDLLINRTLLSKQLESLGCTRITLANNGLEALEQISMNTFDIILTDIRMPAMSGLELTKTLRRNSFNAPIIGISANNLETEKETCLSAGMDSYVIKPYSLNELLIEIAHSLNLKYKLLQKKQQTSLNGNGNFNYQRIKEITASEAEFNELKQEIVDEVIQNVTRLKSKLSVSLAHENVNKAGYFGNEEFLNLCRDLEDKIRKENAVEAHKVLSQIENILAKNT